MTIKDSKKIRHFLDEFFECNSTECNPVKRPDKDTSFKESVKSIIWSDDDESNDKS